MIGKTVNHYKILEKLGEGGMGVVYKAEDTKLHRNVALKFLPHGSSENEEAKQRFINEARAASALDHPNICTLYEIGETAPALGKPGDGQMYMTMAYYGGQSLKDKLEGGALTVDEAVDIAIQTARGLARAHEEDITHRDIKPANLMVTERDEVKIVDFGLAKLAAVTKFTQSGMTLGTVSYMSPEQAQGITTDHRTDIWSLGVVLYEMLTGEQPFQGDYDQAVVYSLMHEQHEPLSNVSGDGVKELEIIIDHALAKKPEDRYQTAEEMLADLQVVSNNMDGVTAGQKPARLKGRRQSQGKPVLSAILIASFLILAVGLWFFFLRGKPLNERGPVSLAVLPLKGFGEEASEDWFLDSMTDALTTDLSKIGDLLVISQSSAMKYKDSAKSLPEIAKDLNVEYLIDASIIKVGEQVRLSAKLVNAQTNENIWAENFQRSLPNVLKVQAEFARAIAERVRAELTPSERKRFEQINEINPEAYAAYLRGRYFTELSASNLMKAPEQFKKAINLEPGYAAAHAGLAYAYANQGALGVLMPQESLKKTKESATRALSLDPNSSEAYTSLGFAGLLFSTNWEDVEENLLKAIYLNQSNTTALQWYAFYLSAQARHDEAIATICKARRLDPLSPMLNNLTGLQHYFARDYDRAIVVFNQSIETHPNVPFAYTWLSIAQMELGMYDEATKNLHKTLKTLEFNPTNPSIFYTGWLGRLYALNGNREKALQIIKEIQEEHQNEHHKMSIIYAALGENDKAFEHIGKWLESQSHVVLLKVAPWWDPLRSDPRFKDVLKRTGLAD